jgi:putative transcription factor
MMCEVCGKDGNLTKVLIDSSEMQVCDKCTSYGKKLVKAKIPQKLKFKQRHQKEEIEQTVVDNFGKLLKKERQKRKLDQKDFANLIAEKLSILYKIESGDFIPSLEVAKKIGKKLNLKLVEFSEETEYNPEKSSSQGLTLGDMFKKKK